MTRKAIVRLIPAALFLAQALCAAPGAVSRVVKNTAPSVVRIFRLDEAGDPAGSGSGFVVGAGGIIATNCHVLESATSVQIQTRDGRKYPVQGVVAFDSARDYALLKIAASGLPALELGDSDRLEPGEEVIAVGHPLGMDLTVTTGVLSRGQADPDGFLQHSAAIAPGSSGGPLLDLDGRVIGINTKTVNGQQAYSFALAANLIRSDAGAARVPAYTLASLSGKGWRRGSAARPGRGALERYRDAKGAFEIDVPSGWIAQGGSFESEDGSRFFDTMFAPPDAERAQVSGYISDGIVIRLLAPSEGMEWALGDPGQVAEQWTRRYLRANPGFRLIDAADATLGSLPARRMRFTGRGPKTNDAEKETVFVAASPSCRYVVTLTTPLGKAAERESLFERVTPSLVLRGCPAAGK